MGHETEARIVVDVHGDDGASVVVSVFVWVSGAGVEMSICV